MFEIFILHRFSGITESDLQDVKTTLLDVQAAFLTRFSDKTVLIGHSLESDFQALKVNHLKKVNIGLPGALSTFMIKL